MSKTKADPIVKMIAEDWKNRLGKRPDLFGAEIQQAILAACVIGIMNSCYECAKEKPEKYPMTDYVELYGRCFDHIFGGEHE